MLGCDIKGQVDVIQTQLSESFVMHLGRNTVVHRTAQEGGQTGMPCYLIIHGITRFLNWRFHSLTDDPVHPDQGQDRFYAFLILKDSKKYVNDLQAIFL